MLNAERQAAEEIARQAGAIVLELYDHKVSVEYKSPSDPVTEADKRANEYIVAELKRRFPDDHIVAEESDNTNPGKAGQRCWYVDPLDGTKEFLAHNGEFAVMIGLCIDQQAQLGVVYQPATDKLYSGVVGAGATLTDSKGTQALAVGATDNCRQARLVVSRSHRPESIDRIVKELGIRDEIQSGSVGIKIGLIAENLVDLYLHISDKSCVWDTCGPEAILRAAGGSFTDAFGAPYRYEPGRIRNERGIMASNGPLHAQVEPVVREVAKAQL